MKWVVVVHSFGDSKHSRFRNYDSVPFQKRLIIESSRVSSTGEYDTHTHNKTKKKKNDDGECVANVNEKENETHLRRIY